MTEIPAVAWVRGYVLNHLEDGPVCVADLMRLGASEFGFTNREIMAAGNHFAVIQHVVDGELWWTRPANLFAIWWATRSTHPYQSQASHTASHGG
jgi:hypothetical protein